MIERVLEERGARYGKFINHAKIAQSLQEVLHQMPNWPTMDYDMRQALTTITDKIARMGSGDPYYDDNWVDIIGYATLVLNRIQMLDSEPAELYPEETSVNYLEDSGIKVGGCVVDPSLYINPAYSLRPTNPGTA